MPQFGANPGAEPQNKASRRGGAGDAATDAPTQDAATDAATQDAAAQDGAQGAGIEDERRWVRALIALGANLGDRRATLEQAVRDLDGTPGIRVDAVSTFIDSIAITLEGRDETVPGYLNGVVSVTTTLAPLSLLDVLNAIEDAHGRVRRERWGSRTLDLDLIDYDGRTLDSERLTLPHPRAHERDFVLAPWAEIEPDAELPGRGSVSALLEALALPEQLEAPGQVTAEQPAPDRLDALGSHHVVAPAPPSPQREGTR